MHQFDLVGPRYLKTDGRFYSANAIDAYDRRCCINPVRRQTKSDILASLIRCWRVLGIPEYLQMDNKLPMRGSNRYPHSFGLVYPLMSLSWYTAHIYPRRGALEKWDNRKVPGRF